jgi:hypothetical protein
LSYTGGCQDHNIDLARMNPWNDSDPNPVPVFEIRHNGNNDMCEAFITRQLSFDLSPLKEEGAKTFTVNAILLDYKVYNETFNYNWE